MPLASFVIGYHTARIENLLQTLHFLIKYHEKDVQESQLIALCQDNTDKLTDNQQSEMSQYVSRFGSSIRKNMDLPQMMLPKITNFGLNLSKSNKVIVLESDRILPPGYFSSVIDQIEPGIMISTSKMHHLTEPATNQQIEEKTYKFNEEYRSKENEITFRNIWSGNTAIYKKDYYDAGMMDEKYIGYGLADCDMTQRMTKIGVKSLFRDEIELHLWHPQSTYGSGDQRQLFVDNCKRYCSTWKVALPSWARLEVTKDKKMFM